MKELLFKELNLNEELNKAIEDLGFEYATEIQGKTIPLLIEGKDVVGLSKTGSGKTLAFALPTIQMLDKESNKIEALIMCPTRELALQIEEVYQDLLKHTPNVKIASIYGGVSIENQIRKLKQGVKIVIGTPGRIMDHIDRKTLHLENIKIVVLDEADEMLNMGFKEDVEKILSKTPEFKQVTLFSATMPAEIKKISQSFQRDPVIVKTAEKDMVVSTIEQFYISVKNKDKAIALLNLIYKHNPKTALVFANTKKMVDELVEELKDKDIKISGLHGDMSQNERTRVMSAFKSGKINILVASDVAARGIDVNDIEIIFNYDIPQNQEYYIHRIGRSGRAGKKGVAYTFVNGKRQLTELMQIIKNTGSICVEGSLPSKNEIIESACSKLSDKIKDRIAKNNSKDDYSLVSKNLLSEGIEPSKIIDVLTEMLLNLSVKEIEKETFDVKLDKKNVSGKMTRLIIFLGKIDRVSASNIVCALAEEVGLSGNLIGKIDVLDKFSFVDIPNEYVEETLSRMSKAKIRNKNVKIEIKNSEERESTPSFKIRSSYKNSEEKPSRNSFNNKTDYSNKSSYSKSKDKFRDGPKKSRSVNKKYSDSN